MTQNNWGRLTPERVSQWINFSQVESWQYDINNRESMAAKQIEGVAYLWNQLANEGVALLADEVGMGKTFQALGVAALLWKLKPDARVLVMTPNRDICRHWRREFDTFVRRHYRHKDNAVRNKDDDSPIPNVRLCFRLNELVDEVENQTGHLYLTTISTLSGLVSAQKKGEGNLERAAAEAAQLVHKDLKQALNDEGFDLVIMDEAHYLRNVSGGSQRVAAAKALFGKTGSRLSRHNLLLTATPSHTRLSNVKNILSYFTDVCTDDDKTESQNAQTLLERYALRRLRLMEGRDGLYSKLNYRHEKPVPSTFEGRPNAELFFALYQKRLVADLKKQRENRSLMYGYLEGFESMGRQADELKHSESDLAGNQDLTHDDFAKAKDTVLLRELTGEYFDLLKEFPDHPKYGAIVDQCLPKDLYADEVQLVDHKHLIFVRRIPSVRELAQRMNAGYDKLLASMIIAAWELSPEDSRVDEWRRQGWSRDGFESLIDNQNSHDNNADMLHDEPTEELEDNNEYLGSRIAELFVIKKDKGGQTDCANVRQRFVKPESLFSLFLEPSSDYRIAGYRCYYHEAGSKRSDYGNAALYERLVAWSSLSAMEKAIGSRQAPEISYENEVVTVWTLVVPLLPQHLKQKLENWASNDPQVAENFANYLKTGLLYASPVIVELYGWFVAFRRKHPDRRDVQGSYHRFVNFVMPAISNSLLLQYFIAALETFDALCGKIIDHGQSSWTALKRLTSPAWYACGENSEGRQRLILGFNTPFYPNVLVSTSVLQEGVNLHMQCYQIHHYGLAGSPGDNEQRVGRLDRLFGCVNQRLKTDSESDLKIFFPYLQSSVDEEQVASFIERKHRVEAQMDACLQASFDKSVQLTSTSDWQRFLSQPVHQGETQIVDPYPARFENNLLKEEYLPYSYVIEMEEEMGDTQKNG